MKSIKRYISTNLVISSLILLLFSCQNSEASLKNERLKKTIENKITLAQNNANKILAQELEKGLIVIDSTNFLPNLEKLYSDKASLWTNGIIPNKQAEDFIEMVKHANYYGFDSNYFNYQLISNLCDSAKNKNHSPYLLVSLELHLSNEAVRFATFNKYGFSKRLRGDSAYLKNTIDTLSIGDIENLKNGIANNNLKEAINKITPLNPYYTRLQKGLEKFISEHPISNQSVKVRSMKEDSTKAFEEARLALLSYAYLDSTNYKDDSLLLKKIKLFQKQHGLTDDGKIGSATAYMMSKSNEERYQQAAISLEKLRHKTFDSTDYFLVNIPAYTLNIVEKNKIINKHRVVVGKFTTKTPTFDASMQYLILNPYWAIPYSISSQEILPQIKKNVSVIEKKGYTIMDQNRNKVDYSSVDWSKVTASNFNYRITQTRSGGTALGKVKFIFPNNHSIYFHDTPSKSLFKNDVRAYSHGCVRVHEPLKLAEYILKKQDTNLTYDSIVALTNTNNQKRFNLKKQIPVHIDYYTAFVDENDDIQFYRDIYNRDKVYKKLLFSKK